MSEGQLIGGEVHTSAQCIMLFDMQVISFAMLYTKQSVYSLDCIQEVGGTTSQTCQRQKDGTHSHLQNNNISDEPNLM